MDRVCIFRLCPEWGIGRPHIRQEQKLPYACFNGKEKALAYIYRGVFKIVLVLA